MTNNTNEAVPVTFEKQDKLPAANINMSGTIMNNPALFEHTWRVAKAFASSAMVPKHLQNKPENCFVALDMARALNEQPLNVLQNIYFANDKPAWLTQYLIGKVNRSGLIKGRIGWRIEGEGQNLKVTAYAFDASTGEELSAFADMKMAEAEGWTRNSKYKTMPEHMLRYRSATFLFRFYFPDVMFGLPTADELEDMKYAGQLEEDHDGVYRASDEVRASRKERGAAAKILDATEPKTETQEQKAEDQPTMFQNNNV